MIDLPLVPLWSRAVLKGNQSGTRQKRWTSKQAWAWTGAALKSDWLLFPVGFVLQSIATLKGQNQVNTLIKGLKRRVWGVKEGEGEWNYSECSCAIER